jgi:hypothetical protein
MNKDSLFINNIYKNKEKVVKYVSQQKFYELLIENKDKKIFIGCDIRD